jgi:hypothetical protein
MKDEHGDHGDGETTEEEECEREYSREDDKLS